MSFNAGDKVTHDTFGEGTITFGPYPAMHGPDLYLMLTASGYNIHTPVEDLKARPDFTVGDMVTHLSYGPVTVVFGPFKGVAAQNAYLIETESGTHKIGSAVNMQLLAKSAPEVGNRVRVTAVSGDYNNHLIGREGTLSSIDAYDDDLPYKVIINGLTEWVRNVEKI